METTPLHMRYRHRQNHAPPTSPAFRINILVIVHLNETLPAILPQIITMINASRSQSIQSSLVL